MNELNKIFPDYKMVHVTEVCKVAEIRDAFNRLKFKVVLTDYIQSQEFNDRKQYRVSVINYFTDPEGDPLIVFEAPAEGEPPIYDYNVILKIYNECVDQYTSIVKADTREYQDIDIFAKKIGYEVTCPNCCATCKFVEGIEGKYRCANPLNIKEYEFDIDVKKKRDNDPYGRPDLTTKCLILKPKVDRFGKCMRFEPFKEK